MKQYKVLKQKLKSTNGEFFIYRFLSKKCRSAYNTALANIKKHYEEENKYIGKYDNFTELQNHDLTNWLNKEIFQRTIYKADTAYRSYFELLKYQKNNNLEITAKEPDYINGYFPITFSYIGNKYENGKRVFNIPLSVPFKRFLREMAPDINYLKQFINVNILELPNNYFIKLSIPKVLTNKKIKEISIIPLHNGRKFEIAYTYLEDKETPKAIGNDVMAIDLGINNLATCVTTKGKSFIIDGKRIKSMNQYYNKRIAELRSENPYCLRLKENPITKDLEYKKDLRKNLKQNEKYISIRTKRMINLMEKRNNKINDYIYKSAKMIIDYCMNNEINKIVLGYSNDFQKGFEYSNNYDLKDNYLKHIEKNVIKENNQKFLSIPFGKLKSRLEYLCKNYGIELIIQEESYTSLSSFMDLDELPVYKEENKEYLFSGKRVKRGLYETKEGKYINADLNGALNIYRKSSVCDMEVISNLIRRGVSTPKRLQII